MEGSAREMEGEGGPDGVEGTEGRGTEPGPVAKERGVAQHREGAQDEGPVWLVGSGGLDREGSPQGQSDE